LHKSLGPGLLESPYEDCFAYDLSEAGLYVQHQVLIPIQYKALRIPDAFRIDLIIEKKLIIEVKAVEKTCHFTKPSFLLISASPESAPASSLTSTQSI
jgi:GxxExxY protein